MKNTKSSSQNDDFLNEFNIDDETIDLTPIDEEATPSRNEDFASLFSQSVSSAQKKLRVGDKIRGKILNLGSKDVFVTTGTLHDGVIQRVELLDAEGNCPYQVGDVTDFYVTLVKGDDIRLSKKTTDRNLADDIKSAFEFSQPIPGRIVEVCKGGVKVNIKGKIAFCPISQIDSKHIESAEEYVGKSFDFKITEISEGGKNVVVSRRKLLDAERELGTSHFLSETKDGEIATGRVTRFETFGAFIELAPGVEGLVHISEIAWSRIASPAEVLTLGQTVSVKLLKREVLNGKAKISLSIKQVTPKEEKKIEDTPAKDDPWQKLSVGQVISGKVNRKEPYGLFVQLEPGITGLLHKSRTDQAAGFHFEKIRVNDSLTVQIAEIRSAERQISLGLPGDPSEHDWKTSYQQDSVGSLGTLASKMNAALLKKK